MVVVVVVVVVGGAGRGGAGRGGAGRGGAGRAASCSLSVTNESLPCPPLIPLPKRALLLCERAVLRGGMSTKPF